MESGPGVPGLGPSGFVGSTGRTGFSGSGFSGFTGSVPSVLGVKTIDCSLSKTTVAASAGTVAPSNIVPNNKE